MTATIYVDSNLKHYNDFITKLNKCLIKETIKNEVSQLLSKHKHGENVHGHREQ